MTVAPDAETTVTVMGDPLRVVIRNDRAVPLDVDLRLEGGRLVITAREDAPAGATRPARGGYF